MSIGEAIKIIRKEKGLTQKSLAEKANISRSYLADVENSRYNPSLETLQNIGKALGVDIKRFFNNDKDNISTPKSIESIKFNTATEALKFILEQPVLMNFGGYNLDNMSDEEILELANDMLFAMKFSLEKKKHK